MASFSRPPFFSSLVPIKKKKTLAFSTHPKNFLTFKNSKVSSSNAESSPLQENSPESQSHEEDPVKLAFSKAMEYRKSKQSRSPAPTAEVIGKKDDGPISDDTESDDVKKEVPLAVKLALEKANEYKKSKNLEEPVSKIVENSLFESAPMDGKNDGLKSDKDDNEQNEVPLAIKLALEKAKKYKETKGVVGIDTGGVGGSETLASGLKEGNEKSSGNKQSIKNSGKKGELTVSSIDFMGLGFSDKKSGRDLPAGLVPLSDPFPEGELPEVEILVGDRSRFNDALAAPNPSPVKEDDVDVYKPKVSTWGLFPRPSNISKTYGGGRTIRPGEALETAEEKAAKEARTRQMVAAYKTRIGLNIDPKLKSECEKALKDGDSLMDRGELEEALPFYEIVMEKLPFQSELHGLAALQWSICQDSLTRRNEARVMYEKLQSHPSPKVSKKARQFVFGFQAMEMLKVSKMSGPPASSGYQNYFEAFVQNKTNYPLKEAQVEEDGLNQTLPYVIFLLSPILMVLLLAASRFE
ncbi:hypothetical protein DH2020_025864 [Rehmannia glutinosa]|uniref:Uncharacterized protein n=1 Tax=Rehmannia glutinosa TaxID=99300 RepID=A0ABR0W0E9_REHGL